MEKRVGSRLVVLAAAAAISAAAVRAESLNASPYRDYAQWTRVNDEAVFSATHGGAFVFTYVNPTGSQSALEGKFPFPVGTVIVKAAFANNGCKPGAPGATFVMEKRPAGYDPAGNDWYWERYNPDGTLWGEGDSTGRVGFCAKCHKLAAVNDYVFGNGTRMRVKPAMPLTPCGSN